MRRATLIITTLCFALLCNAQKDCPQLTYQLEQYARNPLLRSATARLEDFTQRYVSAAALRGSSGTDASAEKQVTIPVIFHILYRNDAENLSMAQIESQLNVLNEDYGGTNADRSHLPGYFSNCLGSPNIRFERATMAPDGRASTGVVRRMISVNNFAADDRMKSAMTGGDDAWDATKYLNIWVCPMANNVLGYASLPGCDPAVDGVVISSMAFGTINMRAPFNKGRTATHEVGHWLNLRHIWGDEACGTDNVDDTPQQQGPNRGCPDGERKTCGNTAHGDLYMNFMDLTDDGCMYMFTAGQKQRMRALFAAGGPRRGMLNSDALSLKTADGALPAPEVSGLTVFPIPANTQLTLQTGLTGGSARLTVYNQLGVAVMTKVVATAQEVLDISALKPGQYFMRLSVQNGKPVRFVKL
jgi:Pregnancy-associated plasma protein-A/Secretion system C-terminal sorting domain